MNPYIIIMDIDPITVNMIDNGFVVGIGAAGDTEPLLLRSTSGWNATLFDSVGAASPTIIAWDNNTILACGHSANYGVSNANNEIIAPQFKLILSR
jgi:hypothetical protein